MANLEAIDKPLPNCPISSTDILDRAPPTLSQLPSPLHVEVTQPRRISRLGPIALTPCAEAGPSRGQRYLYVAVRRGRIPGVYTDWKEAEKQVIVSIILSRLCCADETRTTQTLYSRHSRPKWQQRHTSMAGMEVVDILYL
jgi:hypothetical protein